MSFLLMGLMSAFVGWLASAQVRSPRLRSVIWAGAFAALASPIIWVGHGIGVTPAFFWFAGLVGSGADVGDIAPGAFVGPTIGVVATFAIVFVLVERAHKRSIRALVSDPNASEVFRTADECVKYLLQLEGSRDHAFGAIVQNTQQETLTCVLGGTTTTYVYKPASWYGNVPSYSRAAGQSSELVYDLFGERATAPASRTVPSDTLASVLTDFLIRGGRSRHIDWET